MTPLHLLQGACIATALNRLRRSNSLYSDKKIHSLLRVLLSLPRHDSVNHRMMFFLLLPLFGAGVAARNGVTVTIFFFRILTRIFFGKRGAFR